MKAVMQKKLFYIICLLKTKAYLWLLLCSQKQITACLLIPWEARLETDSSLEKHRIAQITCFKNCINWLFFGHLLKRKRDETGTTVHACWCVFHVAFRSDLPTSFLSDSLLGAAVTGCQIKQTVALNKLLGFIWAWNIAGNILDKKI